MEIIPNSILKQEKNIRDSAAKKEETREMARNMLKNTVLNRNLEAYLSSNGLDREKLKGKRILDIGSKMALFAKEGEKEGLDITSLDLAYVEKEGRELFQKDQDDISLPDAVAAVSQHLPFKKQIFDLVTSFYSAFSYVKSKSDIRNNLKESLRVLKKGGELSIFPANVYGDEIALIIYESEDSSGLSECFQDLIAKEQERGAINIATGHSSGENADLCYVSIQKLK